VQNCIWLVCFSDDGIGKISKRPISGDKIKHRADATPHELAFHPALAVLIGENHETTTCACLSTSSCSLE
jgi:hypothetical protein